MSNPEVTFQTIQTVQTVNSPPSLQYPVRLLGPGVASGGP